MKNVKILWLEDDEDDIEFIATALNETERAECKFVTNIKELIAELAKCTVSPRLIIIGANNADMDISAIYTQLKDQLQNMDARIVIYANHNFNESPNGRFFRKVFAYYLKPNTIVEYENVVRKIIAYANVTNDTIDSAHIH